MFYPSKRQVTMTPQMRQYLSLQSDLDYYRLRLAEEMGETDTAPEGGYDGDYEMWISKIRQVKADLTALTFSHQMVLV